MRRCSASDSKASSDTRLSSSPLTPSLRIPVIYQKFDQGAVIERLPDGVETLFDQGSVITNSGFVGQPRGSDPSKA